MNGGSGTPWGRPGDATLGRCRQGPCVVGLTGGLASGKSSVAGILTACDVPVFDADEAVYELYRPGAEGARAVEGLFGESVLGRNGGVDRHALGTKVLADHRALAKLEAVVHPLVKRSIDEWIAGLDRCAVAVVEAALLVETGSFREYDLLVVVWCEPAQQLARALDRGMVAERARALLAAQLPLANKQEVADVVIDNSDGIERLAAEVERAWSEVLRLCAARMPDR